MSAALSLYALPAIGAPWPGQGGMFVGLRNDEEGRTVALILADAQPAQPLKWKAALEWAATVEAEGHADFTLPDRIDLRLLGANAPEQFQRAWHWTSEAFDSSYAWLQYFYLGNQHLVPKSYGGRARAVRRFVLQSFDPSAAAA
jgi:hypothetical protein